MHGREGRPVTTSILTDLPYGSETFDTTGIFVPGTGEFTIQTAGIYELNASVTLNAASSKALLVTVNGVNHAIAGSESTTSAQVTSSWPRGLKVHARRAVIMGDSGGLGFTAQIGPGHALYDEATYATPAT